MLHAESRGGDKVTDRIKFMLDGCDISFVAEAPEDITLKQLLTQCSRIKPDWCACGIRYLKEGEPDSVDISIESDDIKRVDECVACQIVNLPYCVRYTNGLGDDEIWQFQTKAAAEEAIRYELRNTEHTTVEGVTEHVYGELFCEWAKFERLWITNK